MTAEVIFAYEKQQDDELNLVVGEIVTEVTQVDDGWCEGVVKGVRGLFPDNFVKIISQVPQQQPPPPAPITQAPPPQQQQPDVLPMREGQKKRRAKVTYSYTADNDDELTLDLNDIVEIICEDEDGWYKGMLNGREGVFPSNFVSIIEEEEHTPPPPVPRPQEKTRPPSMIAMPGLGGVSPLDLKNKLKPVTAKPPLAESPKPPPPEITKPSPSEVVKPPPPETMRPLPERLRSNTGSRAPLPKAKVTFTYTAQQDDEVTVIDGDVVEVLEQDTEQEGWWMVKKGGKEGLVPENFLHLLPTEKPLPPEPTKRVENPPLPPKKVEAPKPNVGGPQLAGARSVLPKLPDKNDISEKTESEAPSDDLDIPHSGILDNNKMKQRVKKNPVKPPSRSNLNNEEDIVKRPESPPPPDDTNTGIGGAPWQQETKLRKNKLPTPTVTPTKSSAPGTRPKPTKASKPTPPQPTPKPPVGGGSTTPSKSVSTGTLPPSTKVTTPTKRELSESDESGEWKEAFESLQEEFTKFKKELKQDMLTLMQDLDDERKKNAQLAIDVDRLKKMAGFRVD